MDEFAGELIFQLIGWFGPAVLEFILRLFYWLVVGGIRTVWWLLVHGFWNAFCFYRDLWLRLRWHKRRALGRPAR